ncbi:MAG: serine protease [Anaerolineaceae bacterium]|nr:serine protease [Anaerolineaceae bacterium]
MTQNLSTSEQLAFTTVRIQCETNTGSASTGTGCFFSFKFSDNIHALVIITNRHVIEGSARGIFQLTRANTDSTPQIGSFDNIVINNFEKNWIHHPKPEVDLCIMNVVPLLHEAQEQGISFFYRHLDENLLPSQQLLTDMTALEEILMIGYPVGLWDSVNNMPIFRKGITATHPNLNYEGKEEFLIDAACYPGSSGSPVFLYNPGNYVDRQGGTVIGTRIALLGILYAGPHFTVEGEIKVSPIPTQMKPVPISRIPVNLGIVIKAKQILEFKPIIEKML